MTQSILRLPAVKVRTGLSRSSIYAFMSKGTFPNKIQISARSIGWLETEIDEWIKARIAERSSEIKPAGE